MDITSFNRENYHLGRPFKFPAESGGINAIAVPKANELALVSVYTILTAGAFMAWWILIAILISRVSPKRLRNNKAIQLVTAWEITEPFQVMYLMGRFCLRIIVAWYRARKSTHQPAQKIRIMSTQYVVMDLVVGISIFLISSGIVIGGLLAGVFLPGTLVLGNVAPVNAEMVFLPHPSGFIYTAEERFGIGNYTEDAYGNPRANSTMLGKRGVLHAVAAVDAFLNNGLNTPLDDKVFMSKVSTGVGPRGEEDYKIDYNFTLHGHELGLQHLTDLTFRVAGNCTFEYTWYKGPQEVLIGGEKRDDEYYIWPEDFPGEMTGVEIPGEDEGLDIDPIPAVWVWAPGEPVSMYGSDFPRRGNDPGTSTNYRFAILSSTQRLSDPTSESRDPWYLTVPNPKTLAFKIQPGRPPLVCTEQHSWYHQGEEIGTLANMTWHRFSGFSKLNGSQAGIPVRRVGLPDSIPQGIFQILAQDSISPSPIVNMFHGLQRVFQPPLESNAHRADYRADAAISSAYNDVRRFLFGGYILHRNRLREAALEFGLSAEDIRRYNLLRDADNELLPGLGDFVVPSADVSTLRLEALIWVPSIVGFSWLLVLILQLCNCGQRMDSVAAVGVISP